MGVGMQGLLHVLPVLSACFQWVVTGGGRAKGIQRKGGKQGAGRIRREEGACVGTGRKGKTGVA